MSPKPYTRAFSQLVPVASVPAARTQPWKAFWPLRAENYSATEQKEMPWLTWKPDPAKPDDKPWRQWRLVNQSCVTRRGGGGA